MPQIRRVLKSAVTFAAIAITAAGLTRASAQDDTGTPEGGFDLSWNTIDGGGTTSIGGSFELTGTIGQPDAGGPLAGGGFEIIGGFWPGGGPVQLCPADVTGDDLINVSDLLAVISAWGVCPDPNNCPADVNGDDIVAVADLLAVISAWGSCP